MGTLDNISVCASLPALVRYIENPDKNRPPDGLANAAAYISGPHAVEHLFSRGHNGCSGTPALAIKQFRACESLYREKKGGAKEAGLGFYEMTPERYKKKFGHAPAPDLLNENGKVWVEKKPVIAEHIIASLAVGEAPSYEEQCSIDDELCSSPLLKDFYCISNRHYNTDNRHTHILACAFSKDGSRKLSLNQSARRELRKEYDRILVRHGLSIIDHPDLRHNDPDREQWIRQVVSEGSATVYIPRDFERKYRNWQTENPGKTREYDEWMLRQLRRGTVKVAEDTSHNREWNEETGQYHGTTQADAYRKWVARNGTLYDKNKSAAEQEEYLLARKAELDERQKRIYYYEEQWKKHGRYYAVNRYRPDGHRKTMLDLTLELCLVVLDKEYLLFDPDSVEPLPADAPNEKFFARTDKEMQSMIDYYEYRRRLDIRTPDELNCKKQAVGTALAETRKLLAYNQTTTQNDSALLDALHAYKATAGLLARDGSLTPEEEMVRAEASQILAAHHLLSPANLAQFERKHEQIARKTAELEAQIKDLKKDYHDIMFIDSHLTDYRNQAQTKLALAPKDFDSLLRDAIERSNQQSQENELLWKETSRQE